MALAFHFMPSAVETRPPPARPPASPLTEYPAKVCCVCHLYNNDNKMECLQCVHNWYSVHNTIIQNGRKLTDDKKDGLSISSCAWWACLAPEKITRACVSREREKCPHRSHMMTYNTQCLASIKLFCAIG